MISQSTRSMQKGKNPTTTKRVSWIWHETNLMVSNGALGNAEYAFFAIAPRSTLARSGSTWKVLSMGQIELFDI